MKQKYLALNGKNWRTFEGGKVQCERSISRKQTTTEWATGLGRIRQQETEKWNQMTVPRFQTEGKHRTRIQEMTVLRFQMEKNIEEEIKNTESNESWDSRQWENTEQKEKRYKNWNQMTILRFQTSPASIQVMKEHTIFQRYCDFRNIPKFLKMRFQVSLLAL